MNPKLLKPSWRKVVADLIGNLSRTLLVVASIAVGVFAVGTIATMYAIFREDITVSYASAHPANIEVITDPFDEELVKAIERIPGVTNAEGRHMVSVRVGLDGKNWKPLDVMTADDFTTTEMNLLTPISGTTIPNDRELIVREDPMNSSGLQVGDEALVQLADGTTRSMKVVGTVGDQYAAGDFAAPPRGYATLDTAEWLGGYNLYNRLYVQTENGHDEEAIAAVLALVEDKIERTGGTVYQTSSNLTTEHPLESIVLAMIGVLGALGILIMLLSSSLIINTLNALLTQHRRQIGVMKLVGARSMNISVMYIALIIGYGIIALIIAVPLGMAAGYGLSLFMGSFLSITIQGFRIVPVAIILQVILAFAVPLIAGYFPVTKGSKTTVRRAISEDNPVEEGGGTGLLDKLGVWFKWLSRPLLLSIRNTFRRKARLALTLFTLIVAGAIFIAVFNVRYSLNGFMDMLGQHFMADVTVAFSEPYRTEQIEQIAYQVPGVEYIEGWGGAAGEIVDENDDAVSNIIFIAPPGESTLLKADMVAGRWLEPEDEKALTIADSIWQTYPDLKPGDTLRIDLPGNRIEEWEVVGIFRFMNMLGTDSIAYANNETISRLTNSVGTTASYRVVADEETQERQEQVSTDLNRILREQGYKVKNVEAGLITRQQNGQAMNILVIFLLTMAILTAVVGSIGLMGTMGMNVMERTREIGVMRAIGAVDGEIIKSVVVEGLMIGLISWVVAVVISYPISYALLNMISTAMVDASMPLLINWQGFILWLVLVIFLSAVASVVPARSAARLTIREVLAYE
ncbi:MAG: ABC transporter permease [Anaerolineae bacterium]|nr:ABC transporter permease [Anaerolineae bacterium]